MPNTWRISAAIVLIGSVVAAGGVSAQRARRRWGRLPEGPGVPIRYAQPGFEDRAFTVCKVQYTSVRYEDMGVGWATDHKALPEYRIVDVPKDRPIRHTLFNIETVIQVTNIQFWMRSEGQTSERGSDSPHANFRMIADDKNRVMVAMTHNTDIGDSREREGEDHEFFVRFSPVGYSLGVNVLL